MLDQSYVGYVGSRTVSIEDHHFTQATVEKTLVHGHAVVSGGAKGIDTISQITALQRDGIVLEFIADSMINRLKNTDVSQGIRHGRMLILSPVNPDAGFQTGVAMMRNKFIYAQSDATVVVRSENGKGGTWAGAIENLRHRWSPLYCWERPDYAGNAALIEKGAIAINETWNGDISASAYWQDNITTQTNIASNGKQLSMWDAE